MKHILIIDDEIDILRALRRLLLHTPCTSGSTVFELMVEICDSPMAALEKARHTNFDLILSDYRMPEIDGVTLLKEIRKIQPDVSCLIMSAYIDLNGLIAAINELGIQRFISKPWRDYELVATLAQVLAYRDLQQESARLAEEMRAAKKEGNREEIARKRLEAAEPGITKVNWGPDGSVIFNSEYLDEE